LAYYGQAELLRTLLFPADFVVPISDINEKKDGYPDKKVYRPILANIGHFSYPPVHAAWRIE